MKYKVIKNKRASQILEGIKQRMEKRKATTEYLLKMHCYKFTIPVGTEPESR